MSKYQKTHQSWNKIAKQYEEKFMLLDLYNSSFDEFLLLFPNDGTVLDIGCGPGNTTKYFIDKKPKLKILGIDIAPKMIDLARINVPQAFFEVLDARNIGEINEKFNAIIGGFCVPYLSKSDVSALVQNSRKLLSENGALYLSFVAGEEKQPGYISGSTGDEIYFYFHEIKFIEKELNINDFELKSIINIPFQKTKEIEEIHTVVIAIKK